MCQNDSMVAFSKKILILSGVSTDHHVLGQAFENHPDKIEIDPSCPSEDAGITVLRDQNSDQQNTLILDDSPIKIGAVMDQIESRLLRSQRRNFVSYGDYRLNWQESILTINDSQIDLTDREKEIIYALITAQGTSCERDDLLRSIWDYRPDLETHTLETHIYRLRQKIEDDPADPNRLVTTEGGYRLV